MDFKDVVFWMLPFILLKLILPNYSIQNYQKLQRRNLECRTKHETRSSNICGVRKSALSSYA